MSFPIILINRFRGKVAIKSEKLSPFGGIFSIMEQYHLSLHPTLRTCSADTILRAIKELTQDNISYTSDTGKTYDFNTADMLNTPTAASDADSFRFCIILGA